MAEENNGKNSSIPRGYLTEDTKARLEWVKKYSGIELDDSVSDKAEDLQGIIENHVGFMKVPMAVVGPMSLQGNYAKGEFCVPICTLEGTLAMSMNRGMYASSLCGGTQVKHFRQELSRAPVFIFNNLEEGGYIHLDEYYSLKYPGPKIATDKFLKNNPDASLQKNLTRDSEFDRFFIRKKY